MRHLGDITKINGAEIEPVDVITGGSPCQDLSVAGKRGGLDGERSGLFMDQIRIVKEMRQHDRENGIPNELCRPRFMVWENVPGAFSSNECKDFQAVLTEIVRIVEPEAPDVPMPDKWPMAGLLFGEYGSWSIAWRQHDAQYWGVAQRRKRIALVADFGGECAGEILFERKSLSRDTQQSESERERTAGNPCDGVKRNDIEAEHDYTLLERAGCAGGGKGALIQTDKSATLSCANTQTVFQREDVHGVAYTIDGRNAAVNKEKSGTLQAKESGGFSYNCVNPVAYFQNTGAGWWNEGEVAETNRTPCGGESTKANLVAYAIGNGQADGLGLHEKPGALNCMHDQQAICYGICSYGSNAMKSSNPHRGIYEAETSRCLDANGGNPACNQGGMTICETVYDMTHANDVVRDCGNIAPTLQGRMGTGGNQIPITIEPSFGFKPQQGAAAKGIGWAEEIAPTLSSAPCGFPSPAVETRVGTKWIVRRLTPTECERLQGFPDGWTDIGEWIDSKGNKHDSSDTGRYKALWNSIAVGYANRQSGFWMWLMKRISAQYTRSATLGSLFDGIGGFPLAWEFYNGKGSARWASEIEEFCIAVTKRRFGESEASPHRPSPEGRSGADE